MTGQSQTIEQKINKIENQTWQLKTIEDESSHYKHFRSRGWYYSRQCREYGNHFANTFMLPSPTWFTVVDLVGAYIPMGYIGGKLVVKKK